MQIKIFILSLQYQNKTNNLKQIKMNATEQKIEQSNTYTVFDSMGRRTGIYYCASNYNEAFAAFKADKVNYQKYYYGKLKRCYNGGVRG